MRRDRIPKMWRATWESTAAKTSSRRTLPPYVSTQALRCYNLPTHRSALAYTARASAMRARCPPLNCNHRSELWSLTTMEPYSDSYATTSSSEIQNIVISETHPFHRLQSCRLVEGSPGQASMHKLSVIVSEHPCRIPKVCTFDDEVIKRLVVSKRKQNVVADSGRQNPRMGE